jgi:hypothetical protein
MLPSLHSNVFGQRYLHTQSRPSAAVVVRAGGGGRKSSGGGGSSSSGKPRRSSSADSGGNAGAPLNAATAQMARSASKQAGRFTKQRMKRMLGGGLDRSGSGSDQEGADGAATMLDNLRPFVETVTAHLSGGGSDSSGGSSSSGKARDGSGRGRGAKRGAARALMESYVEVFGAALDLEFEEEWEEAEQRLQVRGGVGGLFGVDLAVCFRWSCPSCAGCCFNVSTHAHKENNCKPPSQSSLSL